MYNFLLSYVILRGFLPVSSVIMFNQVCVKLDILFYILFAEEMILCSIYLCRYLLNELKTKMVLIRSSSPNNLLT